MRAETPWSTPEHEAIARLVRSRTGLVFAPAMRPTVEAKIRRAMHERSIAEVSRYLALLLSDHGVFEALVAGLTIGETFFFREPAQLEYIRSTVLPELARSSSGRFLRAWSAGCATGEEAYSLAILLREGGATGATVVGTDISHERLDRARKATYSRWSLRGVPEAVVGRYFQPRGNRYLLVPEIRSAVSFRPLNLSGKSYPSPASGIWGMDLILCRNVLIYLGPEAVAEIAPRLIASLSDEGWLILGASDPPLSDLVPCEVVLTGAGVAYRRPRRSTASSPVVPAPEPRSMRPRALDGEPRATRAERPVPSCPEAKTAAGPETHVTVEACFASRDYARAAELAARALERNAGDCQLWVLRVRALAKQGRFDEAGRVCSAALETHRTSAELTCLHATLLSAAGHHIEAAAAARRALFLDRAMTMAHLVLGHALLRSGDPLGARRALHNAERLLVPLPPEAIVPASDGEPAARLLELVRRQLKLVAAA